MALINSLLTFHYQESYAVVGPILENYGISEVNFLNIVKWSALVSYAYYSVGSLIYLGREELKMYFRKQLNLGILVLLFMTSDLLIAFTIYFAFWHSLKSMTFEIKALNLKGMTFGVREFFKKAIPLSLISYAGIAVLLYINYTFSFSLPPLTIFFISLSILTLPHVFTMDELYRGSIER
jgi:Brp/Blh family beta-carotene 15,15'-monooxygenase